MRLRSHLGISPAMFSMAMAALLTGCADRDPPETGSKSFAICMEPGCSNSPIIGGSMIYELERNGLRNDVGFKVLGFRSANGDRYRIDVQQARLVGLDLQTGAIALDTPAMLDAVIELQDAVGKKYDVRIDDIGSVSYWAPPGGSTVTYRLMARAEDDDIELEVCREPPDPSDWPHGDVSHAMFFEGDRYLVGAKVVWAVGAATAGWFNISCAGTATAKMHMVRHTQAGAANPLQPTLQHERTAMLKAFTSSVCGGHAFTVTGERLYVTDYRNVMPPPASYASIEAVWTPSGAVCIEEHRLQDSYVLPQAEADVIWQQEIPANCPNVPKCSSFAGFPANWKAMGQVLTMNP